MKKRFAPGVFCLCIGLGSIAYAQRPGQDTPPPQQQQQDAQAVSFVGCLTKGAETHQYVITDQKSGDRVSFGGTEKLDAYVNQTVQLNGRMTSRSGEKAFHPETIRVIAASCEGRK